MPTDAYLKEFLQRHELPHDPEVISRFDRFLELLRKASRKTNLIGRLDDRAVTRELFCDSLTIAALQWPLPGPVIDIGSGAGFPGVPLALLDPAMDLHVVEPRGKRIHFVGHAARSLGLKKVTRHNVRIEDAELPPGGLVCSKAFTPVEPWLEIAAPLAAPGGLVAVLCAAEHWDDAREEQAARLGLEVIASERFSWRADAPQRRTLLLRRQG